MGVSETTKVWKEYGCWYITCLLDDSLHYLQRDFLNMSMQEFIFSRRDYTLDSRRVVITSLIALVSWSFSAHGHDSFSSLDEAEIVACSRQLMEEVWRTEERPCMSTRSVPTLRPHSRRNGGLKPEGTSPSPPPLPMASSTSQPGQAKCTP